MVPLGTQIPTFSLPDAHGEQWSPREDSAGTLVIFMCNHCPFVVHVANTLVGTHALCKSNCIEMVGINSNDVATYPDDAPDNMIKTAKQYGWDFPYLFDATQEVAKSFQATCTPDVFLFNAAGKLYYRGQFDDSRPNSDVSTGKDIIDALLALSSGMPSPPNQKPAIGCNIKWK